MFDPANLVEILKTEYGIETREQLQAAMKNLGKIDITPFCGERPKKEGVAS